MAESSNHQPGSKKACYGCEQDRISNLPDEILIHILSLVPTEFSVRTSVLSSRWKNLWASVPTLDFHDDLYYSLSTNLRVMDFIDKVILSHNLPIIQRFRLRVTGIDIPHLNSWIEAIVRRGVQKIDVFMQAYFHKPLTYDLFTCKTLVELELGIIKLDLPASVYFPCLKIFRLSLYYPSNDVTERLFCSCPVLEQLLITGNLNNEKRVFNISSPALRTLELDILSEISVNVGHEITIDAPILENLSIFMRCMTHYFLKTTSPMLKAQLSADEFSHPNLQVNLLGLLKKIFYVKHLHLSTTALAALKVLNPDCLPIFSNLKYLELDFFCNSDCSILSAMLHRMPSLATLIFWRSLFRDRDESRKRIYWTEPNSVPACLQSCFEEVTFNGIEGWPCELKLIKYFLKIATNLNRMTIMYDIEGGVKINKFLEKVQRFPRRSKTCQVECGMYP